MLKWMINELKDFPHLTCIQALKHQSLFPVYPIPHWTLMNPISISQNCHFVSPSPEPLLQRYHSPSHS